MPEIWKLSKSTWEKMTTITSPWLFAHWGIDIVGRLPQGKEQLKFLLVAIDYFTK